MQLELLHESTPETEPNDLPEEAGTIVRGGAVSGEMGSDTDVDIYAFTALPGELVEFEVHAGVSGSLSATRVPRLGSSLIPGLRIRDADGVEVAYSTGMLSCAIARRTTNPRPTIEVAFIAVDGGDHTLEVVLEDALGSVDRTYVIDWVTGP